MSTPSLLNPDYTFSYSKYSCIKEFYYAHIFFAYFVTIAGFLCLGTRMFRPLMWMHVWFGRLYWIGMLWATGTSLLIHNTGLPVAVLISFAWVAIGMSVAWVFINFHQIQMHRKAAALVEEEIKVQGMAAVERYGSLERAVNAAKGRIAMNKTFWERIVSWKAAHGALMITSWINIIGRVFVTPLINDFTCSTYPYYKQIDTKLFSGAAAPLTPVPEIDPNYSKLPWAKTGMIGWGVALSIGPIVGSLLLGMLWVAVEQRFFKPKGAKTTPATDKPEEELLEGVAPRIAATMQS